MVNNWTEAKCRVQYYNRTWESYEYKTVMKRLVYSLIEACEEAYTKAWKAEHNVKRLTEAKKKEMYEDLRNEPPKNYVAFVELYSKL